MIAAAGGRGAVKGSFMPPLRPGAAFRRLARQTRCLSAQPAVHTTQTPRQTTTQRLGRRVRPSSATQRLVVPEIQK